MLRVKDADLEAVVSFLRTHLLGDSGRSATHACVLILLPLQEVSAPPVAPAGIAANPRVASQSLTQREISVLKGVADGLSNAQIAYGLNTTVGSVKGSVQSLFRKLGIWPKRRSALVCAALEGVPPRPDSRPFNLLRSLTQVERSVLEDLLGHRTNKEIAQRLQIPEIAVKAAIRGLCVKGGVPNRTQLAKHVLRGGAAAPLSPRVECVPTSSAE